MKRLRTNLPLKIFAGFVATVMFFTAFLSCVFMVKCIQNDVYIDGGTEMIKNSFFDSAAEFNFTIDRALKRSVKPFDVKDGKLSVTDSDEIFSGIMPGECNFIYTLKDSEGNTVYTAGEDILKEEYEGVSPGPRYDGDYYEPMEISSNIKILRGEPFFRNTRYTDSHESLSESFESLSGAENELKYMKDMDFSGNIYMIGERVSFLLESYRGDEQQPIMEFSEDLAEYYAAWARNGYQIDFSQLDYEGIAVGEGYFIRPNGTVILLKDLKNAAVMYEAYGSEYSEPAGTDEELLIITDPEEEYEEAAEPDSEGNYPLKVVSFPSRDVRTGKISTLVYLSDGEFYFDGKKVSDDPERLAELIGGITTWEARNNFISRMGYFDIIRDIRLEGECYPYESKEYVPEVYLNGLLPATDSVKLSYLFITDLISYADIFPLWIIVSGILFLISILWLVCTAGYRKSAEGPSLSWLYKIPFEIIIFIGALAAYLIYEAYIFAEYQDLNYYRIFDIVINSVTVLLGGAVYVYGISTFAARIRNGKFWRYTVIGTAVSLGIKFVKFVIRLFSSIKTAWKAALLCLGLYIADYIGAFFISGRLEEFGIFIIILANILFGVFIVLWSAGFTKLSDYVKKIADGELNEKIDKGTLFGDLRKTADALEGVGEGVKRAVDERMRSERFKTELITNVSHDLKTPLTSIVNYIDILSKDNIEDGTAKEHIEVLQRQAARMKKLIEDLVEVSKASSGNVSVNAERTDVNLLVTQSAAEYSDKFEASQLTPVINIPETVMTAKLDGRLMWRVLDNLLNNICKYAMPGTRVYITVEDAGKNISVSFKNISRYQLNMTGEDLMERFVRGDASRNTEGSGLGLSIAKSLCDLQGVGFGLTADGDLFKAELWIEKCGDGEILEEEGDVDVGAAAND